MYRKLCAKNFFFVTVHGIRRKKKRDKIRNALFSPRKKKNAQVLRKEKKKKNMRKKKRAKLEDRTFALSRPRAAVVVVIAVLVFVVWSPLPSPFYTRFLLFFFPRRRFSVLLLHDAFPFPFSYFCLSFQPFLPTLCRLASRKPRWRHWWWGSRLTDSNCIATVRPR